MIGLLIISIGGPIYINYAEGGGSWWVLSQAVPPIATVSIIMGMKYGSPKNWWSPYFGHDVYVNKNKIAERERAGENPNEILKEIDAWVKNCAKGRSIQINGYRYRFLRKGDAAFFKLAWG